MAGDRYKVVAVPRRDPATESTRPFADIRKADLAVEKRTVDMSEGQLWLLPTKKLEESEAG